MISRISLRYVLIVTILFVFSFTYGSTIFIDSPGLKKGLHTLKIQNELVGLKIDATLNGSTLHGIWTNRNPMPKQKHLNDMMFDNDGYIEINIFPKGYRYITKINFEFITVGEFIVRNMDTEQILALRNTNNKRGEAVKFIVEDNNSDSWQDGMVTYRFEDYNKDGGWGTIGKYISVSTESNMKIVNEYQNEPNRVISLSKNMDLGKHNLSIQGPMKNYIVATLQRNDAYSELENKRQKSLKDTSIILGQNDYIDLSIQSMDWTVAICFEVIAENTNVYLLARRNKRPAVWTSVHHNHTLKQVTMTRCDTQIDTPVGKLIHYRLAPSNKLKAKNIIIDEIIISVK